MQELESDSVHDSLRVKKQRGKHGQINYSKKVPSHLDPPSGESLQQDLRTNDLRSECNERSPNQSFSNTEVGQPQRDDNHKDIASNRKSDAQSTTNHRDKLPIIEEKLSKHDEEHQEGDEPRISYPMEYDNSAKRQITDQRPQMRKFHQNTQSIFDTETPHSSFDLSTNSKTPHNIASAPYARDWDRYPPQLLSKTKTPTNIRQVENDFWKSSLSRGPRYKQNYTPQKLEKNKKLDESSDHRSQLVQSGMNRRQDGIQPNEIHNTISDSNRKASKSLEDIQRRRVVDISRLSQDPLDRISHEQDAASLTELGQALQSIESPSDKPVVQTQQTRSLNKDGSESGWEASRNSEHDRRDSRSCYEREIQGVTSTNSFPPQQSTTKRYNVMGIQNGTAITLKTLDDKRLSFASNRGNSSPRNTSSKILALVAKFDSESAQTEISSQFSMWKSATISRMEGSAKANERLHDSLVAPYTTNPSSPSKSQLSENSGKSEKTPTSIRASGTLFRPLMQSTSAITLKNPIPERGPRTSIDDFTPLRKVQKPLDDNFTSLGTTSSDATVSKFTKLDDPIPLSGASVTESNRSKFTGDTPGMEGSIKPPAALLATGPSPQASVEEVMDIVTGDGTTADLEPSRYSFKSPTWKETSKVSQESLTYPGSLQLTLTDVNPPNHYSASEPSLCATPPPSRGNSVLYSQIKNLQGQLQEMFAETHRLRQQLDARNAIDINRLNEQLQATKADSEKWKARAMFAEKQLHMVLQRRTTSTSTQSSCSKTSRIYGKNEPGNPDVTTEGDNLFEIPRTIRIDATAAFNESPLTAEILLNDVTDIVIERECSI